MTHTHTRLLMLWLLSLYVTSDSQQNLQLAVMGVTRTHASGSSSIGRVDEFFCSPETIPAKLKLPLYSHKIRSWIKMVLYKTNCFLVFDLTCYNICKKNYGAINQNRVLNMVKT